MQTPWSLFDKRWNLAPMPPANEPIFLLGAVWRSGTTLVQRLLSSTGEALLWGEPYGDAGLIPSVMRSASVLLRKDWPMKGHYPRYYDAEKSVRFFQRPQDYWMANLYPEPDVIRQSFRSMLDTFLQQPAKKHNRERFGLKEIRLDGECAKFLHWLYPDARFVFLVRNPWKAWSSYKGADWYFQWPDVKVENVMVFSKLWLRNMKTFLAWKDDPSAMFLRFEDIFDQGKTISALEEHCRLTNVERSVLSVRIRGMLKPPLPPSSAELDVITRICGPLAKKFGYTGINKIGPSSFLNGG